MILKRINPPAAAGIDYGEQDGAAFTRFSVADEEPVLLTHGGGRMAFSTSLLSISMRPSSTNTRRPCHRVSVQSTALPIWLAGKWRPRFFQSLKIAPFRSMISLLWQRGSPCVASHSPVSLASTNLRRACPQHAARVMCYPFHLAKAG